MPATTFSQTVNHLIKRGQARFFVDTCFILNEKAFAALDAKFLSILKMEDATLVVPYPVTQELKKHSKNKTDPVLQAKALKALETLSGYKAQGLIRILGSADETFADQVFLEVFTKYRPKYDLVLFTHDKSLCRDLLRLNSTESTSRCANEIWIARYDGKKIVAHCDLRDLLSQNNTPRQPQEQSSSLLFPRATQPRVLDNTLVGSSEKLTSGAVVRAESGVLIKLGKAIAAGGEGEIFSVDDANVAKIYFSDRRTAWRSDKLALLCERQIGVPGVCWPATRLFSQAGGFLGYLMPSAMGKPLQHSAFGKSAIQENFPKWNRLNLATLALSIAKKVSSLNSLGVTVGDLNPMNFLVVSDSDVFLVDADSVQVCDFPCPVGMVTFRAPEITEPSFEKFLRTDDHEAFALASLIFMVLMGGKPPFSFQGGGDPGENIRQGKFPYVTDQSLIPAGAYRYIWSYFPYFLKRGFERAFVGRNPSNRPTAQEWVTILSMYQEAIRLDKLAGAREIWPNSFRPFEGKDYVQLQCAECSSFFQTGAKDAAKRKQYPKILCGNCLAILMLAKQAGENHTCNKCGKHFRVSFDQVQRHNNVLEVCDDCVSQIVNSVRVCKECSSRFSIERGEVRYFLANDAQMPKRCPACRGKKTPPQKPQARTTFTYSQPPPKPPRPAPSYQPETVRTPRRQETKSLWDMLKSFFE
jgi:hypothetical protein